MSSVIINSFRGMSSRDQKLLKPNVFAELAINASLQDGSLSAIPCPEEVADLGFEAGTIYEGGGTDCDITYFEEESFIDMFQDRVYVSNSSIDQSFPKEGLCFNIGLPLGIPAPTAAPLVSAGVSSGGSFEPRQYMYTFVSVRGTNCVVESPPSPLSQSANCADTAVVSGLQNAPAGFDITHIRLYRFDAGWKSGAESKVQNNSGALMVAQLPIGTANYTDNNPLSNADMLGLLTYDMEPMPTSVDGLGATAFSVFSWVGDQLFISADGMPELRRKNGRFKFDYRIINATYWDGSIYVFTERYNYRIDERAEDGGVSYSNPPYRFEKILPITNKFSASVGNSGVFFHTASGIAVLSGNANALIGTSFMNTSQWKSYMSTNIKTFAYQQYLFVFSTDWQYTHIFEFEDGVGEDRAFSNHVLYPYSIKSMYIANDGRLLFSSGDSVYQFVEATGCPAFNFDEQRVPLCQECCPYDYQFMPQHETQITDYAIGYLKIDPQYGDVTVRLWDRGCGKILVYEATFGGCGEHTFRLPAGCLSEEHVIQLEGCAQVHDFRIGTSAMEIGLNR